MGGGWGGEDWWWWGLRGIRQSGSLVGGETQMEGVWKERGATEEHEHLKWVGRGGATLGSPSRLLKETENDAQALCSLPLCTLQHRAV